MKATPQSTPTGHRMNFCSEHEWQEQSYPMCPLPNSQEKPEWPESSIRCCSGNSHPEEHQPRLFSSFHLPFPVSLTYVTCEKCFSLSAVSTLRRQSTARLLTVMFWRAQKVSNTCVKAPHDALSQLKISKWCLLLLPRESFTLPSCIPD